MRALTQLLSHSSCSSDLLFLLSFHIGPSPQVCNGGLCIIPVDQCANVNCPQAKFCFEGTCIPKRIIGESCSAGLQVRFFLKSSSFNLPTLQGTVLYLTKSSCFHFQKKSAQLDAAAFKTSVRLVRIHANISCAVIDSIAILASATAPIAGK